MHLRDFFDSEEKEEPKYFNGKVVCANEQYTGFTVGKIYECVDGRCLDDKGTLRPIHFKCTDLSFYGSTFIPLVE